MGDFVHLASGRIGFTLMQGLFGIENAEFTTLDPGDPVNLACEVLTDSYAAKQTGFDNTIEFPSLNEYWKDDDFLDPIEDA